MSSDDDLINFEVGSPDFPQTPLATLLDPTPPTLLDSELYHLEETLQTASQPLTRCNSRDSVELEQILITIDDDACKISRSSRKNSVDIAGAIEELDRIIGESTNSTNQFDNEETEDDQELVETEDESTVEDCLKDLDNYLQGFDTSGSDLDLDLDPSTSSDKSVFSDKLRKLASRSKSLRTGQQNLGYEPEANFKRNHNFRNTIEARHSPQKGCKKRPLSANLDNSLSHDLGQNKRSKSGRPVSAYETRISLDESDERKHPWMKHGRAVSVDETRTGISPDERKQRLDDSRAKLGRPVSAEETRSGTALDESDERIDNSSRNPVSEDESRTVRSLDEFDESQRLDDSSRNGPVETRTGISFVEPAINQRLVSSNFDNSSNSRPNHRPDETRIEIALDSSRNILSSNLDQFRRNILRQSCDSTFRKQKIRPFSAPLNRNTIGRISTSKSVTRDISSDDEDIDWTWVEDEQVAHQVSPPVASSSAVLASSSWLRSSMRRLRHFRLPSNQPPSAPSLAPAASQPVVLNRDAARPVSAPVTVTRTRSESESSRSRSRSRASRARSLSSSESSLDSVESQERGAEEERDAGREAEAPREQRRPCDAPPPPAMPDLRSPLGQWPHGLSSMLACLGCTLGLFNLSRFATLTVRFGANFIIQFLVLSLVFGIPMFTLQLCLGQQLSAGVVDMWRISPLFQGVGIALLAAQALIGLYSIVGVSWMFIYFRDSFITKQDQYKWAEPYEAYREDSRSGFNGTYKISETVPDYFNGIVLQRHNLVTGNSFGAIKFQVAFNLAVVWMIVFVSLSKGLRSYAKVVYVFSLLPIFGTFVLCAKLLGMSPTDSFHEVFPATAWPEFFVNTKSWIAAAQETFLTWGMLGAAVMQISSHNKHKHLLQRDSSLVIILTLTILMLTAFLANTCIEILHAHGYKYVPNSFERISTYVFLRSSKDPLPPSLSSTPVRYMTHSSFIIGERVMRPGMDKTMESGYQVLRFATELVPATLALLGPTQISPFWAVLFYFILILFGIAQQLAIWHCVITGIMAIKAKVLKSWETTITFFTCTFGFILGLPMTTEFGIFVVYFLDYCVGGAWWLIFVYLLQIVAVFMIRGRPYSGDTVVTALFIPTSGSCTQAWLAPLLSFIWNVILPVALMVVCITQFKSGNFRELFIWHHAPSVEYWPTWTRQVGSLLQLMPILCVPIVAIVQSYRYLNNGPPDILDRIQLLYRPPLDSEHMDDLAIQQAATATATAATTTTNIPAEDPPPKYTPPPSYTTATGARIAKMLRQSIRRSVRRIANVLGEGSQSRTVERPHLQVPPPDYSAVLVEMNQSQTEPPHVTIDVTDSQNGGQLAPTTQSDRISRELSSLQPQGSPLTAADVASILRSSFRRSTIRTAQRMRRSAPEETPSGSLSAECLVDGVAPIGQDSLVLETIRNEEVKETDNNRSSVI